MRRLEYLIHVHDYSCILIYRKNQEISELVQKMALDKRMFFLYTQNGIKNKHVNKTDCP